MSAGHPKAISSECPVLATASDAETCVSGAPANPGRCGTLADPIDAQAGTLVPERAPGCIMSVHRPHSGPLRARPQTRKRRPHPTDGNSPCRIGFFAACQDGQWSQHSWRGSSSAPRSGAAAIEEKGVYQQLNNFGGIAGIFAVGGGASWTAA